MTADIDTDRDGADGVVFALGDWFGGYALYLVGGRVHFTFARAADALELATPSAAGAGPPRDRRLLRRRRGRRPGPHGPARRRRRGRRDRRRGHAARWPSSTAGPGCGSGGTAGFPVSRALRAAGALRRARCTGVRVDTPGLAAARPGRRGARRAPRRLSQPPGARVRPPRSTALPGVGQVLAGVARRHRRQVGRSGAPGRRPGRTARCGRAPRRSARAAPPRARRRSASSRATRLGRRRPRSARTACAALAAVDVLRRVGHAVAPRPSPPASARRAACPSAMWWSDDADRPAPRRAPCGAHSCVASTSGRRPSTSALAAAKSSASAGRPLTRHGAPPPARSAPRCSRTRRRRPRRRPAAASRCSSAFTGVGTPWRPPSSTISPLRNSASMEPAPRARLCQLEPPCHSPDDVGAICRRSPRRSRSSSALATSIPAAASASLPSRCASRGQRAEPALGPGQCLDRVGQVHEELAVLPAHDVGPGHRLERRGRDGVGDGLPVLVQARGEAAQVEHARDGAECTWTTPGRSWVAGHMTHMP